MSGPESTSPQNPSWHEEFFSRRGFTSTVINEVPLFHGSFPNFEAIIAPELNELYLQAKERLLTLLKDPEPQVRRAASETLSKSKDHNLHLEVLGLAKNLRAPFEHRKAALESLVRIRDPLIERELAKFIVDDMATRQFFPYGQGYPSYQRNDHYKILMETAARSLQPVKDEEALRILQQANPKRFTTRFKSWIMGIEKEREEARLGAAIIAVGGNGSTIARNLIMAGLKSNSLAINRIALESLRLSHSLRDHSILEQLFHVKNPHHDLMQAKAIGSLMQSSTSPVIRVGIRQSLLSKDYSVRALGLVAASGSIDPADLNLAIEILKTTESKSERGRAIDSLANNRHPLAQRALLEELKIIDEDLKGEVILALKGSNNKRFLRLCLKLIHDDEGHSLQAATVALSANSSEWVSRSLCGMLEIPSDGEFGHVPSRAAEILAKRKDKSAIEYLLKKLDSKNDIDTIIGSLGLTGTKDQSALGGLYFVINDKNRSSEVRQSAIEAISHYDPEQKSSWDKQFSKKLIHTLCTIFSDQNEPLGVRMAAIQALPVPLPSRAITTCLLAARDKSSPLSIAALDKLARTPELSAHELCRDIFSHDPDINRIRYSSLGMTSFILPETIKLMIDKTSNFDPSKRAEAAKLLGHFIRQGGNPFLRFTQT